MVKCGLGCVIFWPAYSGVCTLFTLKYRCRLTLPKGRWPLHGDVLLIWYGSTFTGYFLVNLSCILVIELWHCLTLHSKSVTLIKEIKFIQSYYIIVLYTSYKQAQFVILECIDQMVSCMHTWLHDLNYYVIFDLIRDINNIEIGNWWKSREIPRSLL